MKNKLLRITCALFALCMLLAALTLSVSADTTKEWSISKDRTSISNGTTTYTLYNAPNDVYWLPVKTLYYYDVTYMKGTDEEKDFVYTLQSVNATSEILYLEGTFAAGIYVSDDARAALEAFEREENVEYRIFRTSDAYAQSTLKDSTVQALKGLSVTQNVDVTTMQKLKSYNVVYYDESGSLYRQIGILFYFADGGIGFVSFAHLNNSHFDAYGNFSFRSGTAPVCMIEDEALLAAVKDAASSTKDQTPEESYETDAMYLQMMQAVSIPLFWVLFAITGAVLPTVGLILSIVWTRSPKNKKHPRRWYVPLGLCALWLLLTLTIFLMMVI